MGPFFISSHTHIPCHVSNQYDEYIQLWLHGDWLSTNTRIAVQELDATRAIPRKNTIIIKGVLTSRGRRIRRGSTMDILWIIHLETIQSIQMDLIMTHDGHSSILHSFDYHTMIVLHMIRHACPWLRSIPMPCSTISVPAASDPESSILGNIYPQFWESSPRAWGYGDMAIVRLTRWREKPWLWVGLVILIRSICLDLSCTVLICLYRKY